MEHLLVDENGTERLYLGFNRSGQLITDVANGINAHYFEECEITDWTIKPYIPPRKMKKVTMYQAVTTYFHAANSKIGANYIFKTKEEALTQENAIGFVEVQVEVFE